MSAASTLAYTPGEPAGIGPDLALTMTAPPGTRVVVIADPELLRQRARQLGVDRPLVEYDPDTAESADPECLLYQSSALRQPVQSGMLNPANADYVLQTIRNAVQGCVENRFDALVTGPVHKGVINDAGIPFSGHTEYLAELLHASPLMVLIAGELRVALATTHLPLSAVSAAINRPLIENCLQILDAELKQRFAIAQPRILVCGLNPHAGESGHLGHEEIDSIEPAIVSVRKRGIDARGPMPADTLFTPRHLQQADAVLSMFHDQGLPVLKYAGFGSAVNITFGLPIIRTSVDHGTALDLAGSGRAADGSLNAALQLAATLVARRHGTT